jgi:hypothetical protein
LFKKAMKQRRGSVENVAETLMMALAASGESQENIAKVKKPVDYFTGGAVTFNTAALCIMTLRIKISITTLNAECQ